MTVATETKPVSPNPSGWRPSAPVAGEGSSTPTVTGNRALMLEEPLLFEIGSRGQTGVDFEPRSAGSSRLGGLERQGVDLPGLSEPEAVRHYTRLSRQNYAIDLGLFPLGSCTMKHNPRLNEKLARLPGFADIHPLQPQETVQGALELINRLADRDHVGLEQAAGVGIGDHHAGDVGPKPCL